MTHGTIHRLPRLRVDSNLSVVELAVGVCNMYSIVRDVRLSSSAARSLCGSPESIGGEMERGRVVLDIHITEDMECASASVGSRSW